MRSFSSPHHPRSLGFHYIALAVCMTALPVFSSAAPPDDQSAVRALADIEREGGTIDIERFDLKTFSSLEAPAENIKDKQIAALQFRDLKGLQKALAEAGKLKQVKKIGIDFCWTGPRKLSKAEVDKILAVETLEELNLRDLQIDAEQLKRLAKLPKLKTITMDGKFFVDAHVAAAQHLKSLRSLTIKNTQKISAKAVGQFRKDRTDCKLIPPKKLA